jgi:hypothetical protein
MLHGCDGTTRAESIGMIRIALLLATLAPLTACIGPSRTPGRLGGALVAMTGAALAFDGHTSDCGDLGCALGNGFQASFGTNLLIAGVVTLIINEVRYVPPAEPPRSLPPECRTTTVSAAWYTRRDDASRASCSR